MDTIIKISFVYRFLYINCPTPFVEMKEMITIQ